MGLLKAHLASLLGGQINKDLPCLILRLKLNRHSNKVQSQGPATTLLAYHIIYYSRVAKLTQQFTYLTQQFTYTNVRGFCCLFLSE